MPLVGTERPLFRIDVSKANQEHVLRLAVFSHHDSLHLLPLIATSHISASRHYVTQDRCLTDFATDITQSSQGLLRGQLAACTEHNESVLPEKDPDRAGVNIGQI
jgi:hypothetical protein